VFRHCVLPSERGISLADFLANAILTAVYDNCLPGNECSIVTRQKKNRACNFLWFSHPLDGLLFPGGAFLLFRLKRNQGASVPVFLRKLDCIVLSSQITFREGRNRRGKRRDALPPRMARLSESFNSELREMRCLEFTARSRRRYGKSVPYRT
jgi:hypothetical protein